MQGLQDSYRIALNDLDGRTVLLQFAVHGLQGLGNEVPVTSSIVRVLQKLGFNDVQQQQRLAKVDRCCERCMIAEPQVSLEPDHIHDACTLLAMNGFTTG